MAPPTNNPPKPTSAPAPSVSDLLHRILEENQKMGERVESLAKELTELKQGIEAPEFTVDDPADELDGDELEHPPEAAAKPADVLDIPVQLGCKVRDTVSGFTGVAVLRSTHMNGCVRYYVQPMGLDDRGRPKHAEVFDVNQLVTLSAPGKFSNPSAPPGGPTDPLFEAQVMVDAGSDLGNQGTLGVRSMSDRGLSASDVPDDE